MEEQEYYVISLKWTYPNSVAFTLWGPENRGYYWWKEWSGVYKESDLVKGYNCEDTHVVAVKKELLEDQWIQCLYYGKLVTILPNTPITRSIIGIKKKDLQGGMSNILESDIEVVTSETIIPDDVLVATYDQNYRRREI